MRNFVLFLNDMRSKQVAFLLASKPKRSKKQVQQVIAQRSANKRPDEAKCYLLHGPVK